MTESANVSVKVEVAVESVAGALAALAGGADRIELCQALSEGGLTPSVGLLEAVRGAVPLPVFAMVRPRGGDFLYDGPEFDVMCRDVAHLVAAGAHGIVTGVLDEQGRIHHQRMAELIELADDLPVTCHRAFDVCADARASIDVLCELGVARVLTSGQAATAPEGLGAIRTAVRHADGRLAVVAGAGVRADNVDHVVTVTGAREVHLSATAWRPSGMAFRRAGVVMGSASPPDEYAVRHTDETEVARVVAALRNC